MATTTTTTEVLSFEQGESLTRTITVTVPDPTSVTTPPARLPVDLSIALDGTADRPAIVRAACKLDLDDTNESGLFFKTSYSAEEINFLDQVTLTGQALLYVDEADTDRGEPSDCYILTVRVTRQDFLRTAANTGTIDALTDGSGSVVGTGTAFTSAKQGDVLTITSGVNNGVASRIESITDDSNIVTEKTNWQDDAGPGITFEIRRADNQVGLRQKVTLVKEGME